MLQTPIPIEVCEELYRQLIKFPVSIIFSTDDFDYRIGTEEEIEESIVEQIHLFHLDLEPEKIDILNCMSVSVKRPEEYRILQN